MQVNIKNLIDDAQCYQTVRELRWPDGITCPSKDIVGHQGQTKAKQRGFGIA
jgi:hypothetical protein